jgi:NADH-quinone oxidoreductase subunit C
LELTSAARELLARFGATESPGGAPPTVPTEQHLKLALALRDAGYRQFGFVVAAHYPARGEGGEETLRVVYGLRKVGAGSTIVTWQVEVPVGGSIPTLSRAFAGADWQEREQFDLVGVHFDGHPDLRRLMLPEDWKGHPLRKDYAIDTQVPPWR